MKVEHLRTVGDGFCFNHHWPMWSEILAEILECPWKNFSLPGLGNEAIANLVIDQLASENHPNTLWIVQWATPNRVDIRTDCLRSNLIQKIQQDPIYHKNFITTALGKTYWSSSASILPWVVEHRNLISLDQHLDRQKLFETAVINQLQKANCQWQFITTQHMMDFVATSQYRHLDVEEIQPVSSIHLDYLEQFVLPKLEFDAKKLHQARQKFIQADTERKSNRMFVPWDRNMHKRI